MRGIKIFSLSAGAVAVSLLLMCAPDWCHAQGLPEVDQRGGKPRDTNTPRTFPPAASESEWTQRANVIRDNIFVSCGLWPLPIRNSLRAEISGKIERGDYSVEKVLIQSYTGVYVAGNLYRPLGKGKGPFAAVLNPHGHWPNGRMVDTKDGSIAARCINFAKEGIVAFSYDMMGYNDSTQIDHKFAADPTNQLWSINLMGLQTWNSIRAVDFLTSLPDVDPKRLACTGESGGGTQTFMLGAIDKRLAVQAPIVMVSHSMQGGCLCENAPGLRVDFSNMEIAAVAAPRPQILVGATGDWTRTTMTIEGPAIAAIYKLFKAEDQFRYVVHNFDHNYNQTSREDVYGWFNKYLNRRPTSDPLPEKPYQKEPDADLRVFPDGKLRPDALTEAALKTYLIKTAQDRYAALAPTNEVSFNNFKKFQIIAWRHALKIDLMSPADLIKGSVQTGQVSIAGEPLSVGGRGLRGEREKQGSNTVTFSSYAIGRKGKGDRIPITAFIPAKPSSTMTVVLVSSKGQSAFVASKGAPERTPIGIAETLVARGLKVVAADLFDNGGEVHRDQLAGFHTVYNRTLAQERVQDLMTLCAHLINESHDTKVVLCGEGIAGLYCLLAAPAADAVVADCGGIDLSRDETALKPDFFYPGMRRYGMFEGMAALAAPNPVFIYNQAEGFLTGLLQKAYQATGKADLFRTEKATAKPEAIVDWITKL